MTTSGRRGFKEGVERQARCTALPGQTRRWLVGSCRRSPGASRERDLGEKGAYLLPLNTGDLDRTVKGKLRSRHPIAHQCSDCRPRLGPRVLDFLRPPSNHLHSPQRPKKHHPTTCNAQPNPTLQPCHVRVYLTLPLRWGAGSFCPQPTLHRISRIPLYSGTQPIPQPSDL